MTPDPEILALPATRREGERSARERFDVTARLRRHAVGLPAAPDPWTWEVVPQIMRDFAIACEADLLSDLTRPESRDGWVRLLRMAHAAPEPVTAAFASWEAYSRAARILGRDSDDAIYALRACILATFGGSHV